MKKKYNLVIIIALLVSTCLIITNVNYRTELTMNDFNYVTPDNGKYGEAKYELTFENVINKLSSDVIIGEVVDSKEYTDTYNMYNIKVEDVLIGNERNELINIYANKLSLEQGSKYILFLRNHDSALYEYPFYVLLNEFVMKINNEGQLSLLENPEAKKFIKPFKEDKYNEINNIEKYIIAIRKDNVFANKVKQKVINKVEDTNELATMSDHIVEIKVLNKNIAGIKENIAIVDFEIAKAYKGGELENVHSLLLPSDVEANNSYLLFLVNNEESVSIATRSGSVVKVGSDEYKEIIKNLK